MPALSVPHLLFGSSSETSHAPCTSPSPHHHQNKTSVTLALPRGQRFSNHNVTGRSFLPATLPSPPIRTRVLRSLSVFCCRTKQICYLNSQFLSLPVSPPSVVLVPFDRSSAPSPQPLSLPLPVFLFGSWSNPFADLVYYKGKSQWSLCFCPPSLLPAAVALLRLLPFRCDTCNISPRRRIVFPAREFSACTLALLRSQKSRPQFPAQAPQKKDVADTLASPFKHGRSSRIQHTRTFLLFCDIGLFRTFQRQRSKSLLYNGFLRLVALRFDQLWFASRIAARQGARIHLESRGPYRPVHPAHQAASSCARSISHRRHVP